MAQYASFYFIISPFNTSQTAAGFFRHAGKYRTR